jgi:hypothetical protein
VSALLAILVYTIFGVLIHYDVKVLKPAAYSLSYMQKFS